MSVLKSKRSTSKAEYVNLANLIYTETVAFLTRLSARYARLLAEPVAALAGEVIDHTEKANSIFPKGAPNLELRKGHLLEARAALMALDVPGALLHHPGIEPAGVLYQAGRKKHTAGGGHQETGRHGAEPGGKDRPGK